MESYDLYPNSATGNTSWPVIASSLWLRLGFVAACAAVVALTELYRGDARPWAAIAWAFGGAWLAALSWRRAKMLLDRLDDVDAVSATPAVDADVAISSTPPEWSRRDIGTHSVAPRA